MLYKEIRSKAGFFSNPPTRVVVLFQYTSVNISRLRLSVKGLCDVLLQLPALVESVFNQIINSSLFSFDCGSIVNLYSSTL